MDQVAFVNAARAGRFSTYDTVVGMTLVAFDYILNINKERKFIWGKGWGLGKILYFIVRYMPFLDFPIWPFADSFVAGGNLPMDCNVATYFVVITLSIATCVSDVVYGLRTWALWERGRWIGLFLIVAGVAFHGTAIALLATSPTRTPVQRIPRLDGCFTPPGDYAQTSAAMWKAFLLTTSYQLVLFIATVIKGVQHFTQSKIQVLEGVLYRDAFFAFLIQIGVEFVNVALVISTQSVNYSLNGTYRALVSVLSARMILDLREAATTLDPWETTIPAAAHRREVFALHNRETIREPSNAFTSSDGWG
ncbi:hypothetical protein DACRYDRAFT_119850 [Dacryopinax primogenitus]|uniref:DUF6533 domain-containing protein n=1 Tax=Dacryopinax primogenitus (strain DJM 731) TaxID=1858805 RepID=M5FN40_DACPD|nr:uncharacterized protein DACRYDRAFT_119850 [Dacryopinax primogenitus]EJT96780.1 hypothetical protein DACRYDRAFT_119850 [Dacryopinax primogenitus]